MFEENQAKEKVKHLPTQGKTKMRSKKENAISTPHLA